MVPAQRWSLRRVRDRGNTFMIRKYVHDKKKLFTGVDPMAPSGSPFLNFFEFRAAGTFGLTRGSQISDTRHEKKCYAYNTTVSQTRLTKCTG